MAKITTEYRGHVIEYDEASDRWANRTVAGIGSRSILSAAKLAIDEWLSKRTPLSDVPVLSILPLGCEPVPMMARPNGRVDQAVLCTGNGRSYDVMIRNYVVDTPENRERLAEIRRLISIATRASDELQEAVNALPRLTIEELRAMAGAMTVTPP